MYGWKWFTKVSPYQGKTLKGWRNSTWQYPLQVLISSQCVHVAIIYFLWSVQWFMLCWAGALSLTHSLTHSHTLSLSVVHRLNTKVVLVHLYFLASATVSYKCCYVTFIFFIIQPHSTALHHSQMPKLLSYCEFFFVCVCHRFLLVLLLVI